MPFSNWHVRIRSGADEQFGNAIAAAGGRFGPDRREALLARLDAKRFEPVLGPIVGHTAAFSWKFDKPKAGTDDIRPPHGAWSSRPRVAGRAQSATSSSLNRMVVR